MAEVLGEDVILWIYRFILIGIISFGVIIIINGYYSNQDVRAIEANAISNRIINCISKQGIVDESKVTSANILKCTNIDPNEIYVNLTLTSKLRAKILNANIGYDLEVLCLAKLKGVKSDVECLNQIFYVLLGDERVELVLLIGIKKFDKNI